MTKIAYGRKPRIGKKVLVAKSPLKHTGFHALDFSLEAEGYIHEIKPRSITVDLAASGRGSGPFVSFPSQRVFYPQGW